MEETHKGERIVRVAVLTDHSEKPLTKGRASKMLARAYPDLKLTDKVLLIDTPRGWSVVKAIQPRRGVWLRIYIERLSN
jgi:hypothetical protein